MNYGTPLLEACIPCHFHFLLIKCCLFFFRRNHTIQNFPDSIIRSILLIQLIISGKFARRVRLLQILTHQPRPTWHANRLIIFQYFREILPAARRHELLFLSVRMDLIKMILFQIQIGKDCSVHLLLPGVCHPRFQIRLQIQSAHTIKRHDIKLPDRFIVFRRISRCDDHPSVRHLMASEFLILQKLQHRRCQRLRGAVDLIDKKDSLFFSGSLHTVVHRCNDLA